MKILVFVNYVPYLQTTTNEFRIHNIIQKLKEKHLVKILVVDPKFAIEYSEKYGLEVECIKGKADTKKSQVDGVFFKKHILKNVFYKINPKDLDKVYSAFGPDVILVNNLGFFNYVRKYKAKIILNSNDVKYMEFARNAAYMPLLVRKLFINKTRRIRRAERNEFVNSDMIFFGSIKDMSNVNSQLQLLTPSYYLPVYCEKFEKLDLCEKHSVTFSINYNNIKDKKNFKNFLDNIYPKMLKKYSDLEVNIICKEDLECNNPNIHFSQELTEDILKNTRLFILNNETRNNFSYYICKAAAFGIPIVGFSKSTDVFAVKDNSKYMVIVNKNNDATKIDTIEKVFDNNDYLNRIRTNAFDYMVEHYSKGSFDSVLETAIEKIEKLI